MSRRWVASRLMKVACQLCDCCLHRGITLSTSHLPRVINLEAGQESRELQSGCSTRKYCSRFSTHQCIVDLFATHLNHQLFNYVSWTPNPWAMETDTTLEEHTFSPICVTDSGVPSVTSNLQMDPQGQLHLDNQDKLRLAPWIVQLSSDGIPEETSELLLVGRSKYTNSAYQSDWKR